MKVKPKHLKPSRFHRMTLRNKILTSILCFSLIVCLTIGGSYTYAWIVSPKATNEADFSDSTVVIPKVSQATTTANFPMVPGGTIGVDPLITVPKGMNINAYLFIKVAKTGSLDSYVDYSYADGWVKISSSTTEDVYYRNVDGTSSDAKTYYVFKNNQMTVETNNTRDDSGAAPTFTVTAALVQREAIAAADAYTVIKSVL